MNRSSESSLTSDVNNFRSKVFAYDRESTILNYTPDAGFVGENIVKYTVSDGKGGSASAQVEFFVGTEVVVDTGGTGGTGGDSGDSGQDGGVTKTALTEMRLMVVFQVNQRLPVLVVRLLMVTLKYLMNLVTGWIFGNIIQMALRLITQQVHMILICLLVNI